MSPLRGKMNALNYLLRTTSAKAIEHFGSNHHVSKTQFPKRSIFNKEHRCGQKIFCY